MLKLLEPILVPIRGIQLSMKRIRKQVPDKIVNQLTKSLFINTLHAISKFKWEPVILTAEKKLAKTCTDNGYQVFIDSGSSLNEAVLNAVERLDANKISLIMPDILNLDVKSVAKLNSVCKLFCRVIAPSHDKGTAFARLKLEDWKHNLLGKGSYQKIINQMNANKAEISVIKINSLLQDIDVVEDYNYHKIKIKEILNKSIDFSKKNCNNN